MAQSGVIPLETFEAQARVKVGTDLGSFEFTAYALEYVDAGAGYGKVSLSYSGPSRSLANRLLLSGRFINLGDRLFFLRHPRLAKLLRRQRKIVLGKRLITQHGSLGVVIMVIVTKSDLPRIALASAKVVSIQSDGDIDLVELELPKQLWQDYGDDHYVTTPRGTLMLGQQVVVNLPNELGHRATLA